ncbi:MAG: 50S ribosomal protein L23 [Candidatus Dormibacteraeota bacterium]|nr:50S ribosomal protein L23 [Candidatus Dormibacteraeota bacterium]
MRAPVEVLFGPLVSERSYTLYQEGRYTFRVAPDATKNEIAKALEEHYQDQGVKVRAVNTVNVRGKVRRTGRRGLTGRTADWKKAIVTLAPGQKIEGLFGSL